LSLGGCGSSSSSGTSAARSASSNPEPVRSTNTGWPALLHDASHFGTAPTAGPSSGRTRWVRRLEGPIVAGPVTVGGVAYVASNAGVLHAIDISNGRDRWSFNGGAAYGSDLSTAPAVLADGLILWPGPRQRLFALTPSGQLRWTLTAASEPLTPVVEESRGLLVLADTSGTISGYRLNAHDAAPSALWSHKLSSVSYGNPALAADGTIYETAGNSLYSLTPAGRIRWQVRTPAQVEVSPAVAEDDIVVFGSDNRQEYGVASNGTVRWRHAIGNYTYSSPTTLPGHRVIYGNHSGEMSILDTRSGDLISRDRGSGQIWTAAAVDARGDVYFASRTGYIYGFAPDGHALFTLHAGETFDSYPAIAADGTLLVGGDGGVLRAIG
jgi:outer membrane protein assembly factor BamB